MGTLPGRYRLAVSQKACAILAGLEISHVPDRHAAPKRWWAWQFDRDLLEWFKFLAFPRHRIDLVRLCLGRSLQFDHDLAFSSRGGTDAQADDHLCRPAVGWLGCPRH